ncbi:uncharacterized protein A4U43_C08F3990 [Asparagus officinalis]|nr:uncharacterized protein A4U43_C08F3990 [Asparagus officinalis]
MAETGSVARGSRAASTEFGPSGSSSGGRGDQLGKGRRAGARMTECSKSSGKAEVAPGDADVLERRRSPVGVARREQLLEPAGRDPARLDLNGRRTSRLDLERRRGRGGGPELAEAGCVEDGNGVGCGGEEPAARARVAREGFEGGEGEGELGVARGLECLEV